MMAPNIWSLLRYPDIRERVILLDGWSKTYAMTWLASRLAGVWPKQLFPHAEKLAINCHSCVNAATQFAGIAALKGPREPVERMVKAFAERRAYIVEALNSLPGVRFAPTPEARSTHSPMCRVPATTPRRCRLSCSTRPALRRSPATSPGAFGEDYIRISYANSLENLREAIDRMRRRFLGNLPLRQPPLSRSLLHMPNI